MLFHGLFVASLQAQQQQRPQQLEGDEQQARSQATTENNGHGSGSIVPSFVSKEGEDEPMMPGGAQSSILSTTVLNVNAPEAAATEVIVRNPNGSASRAGSVEPGAIAADVPTVLSVRSGGVANESGQNGDEPIMPGNPARQSKPGNIDGETGAALEDISIPGVSVR